MHPKTVLVAAVAAVALASTARAAEPGRLYVGAGLGLSMFHDRYVAAAGTAPASYSSGLGFAGAVGWEVSPYLRVEGELAYRKNGLDRVGDVSVSGYDLTVWSYGVNASYEFATVDLPVKPFLGVGLGWASATLSGEGQRERDGQLSYQGIVGLAYPLDRNARITVQYRYHASPDFSIAGLSVAYASSTVLAGVTYAFSP